MDYEGQDADAIELDRMSNAQWQDLLAMSPETARDPLWDAWNTMLSVIGEAMPDRATWLQYALVCIGPDKTLEVLHGAEKLSVDALMHRLGSALPADPSEAVERVFQYVQRLAVAHPEEQGRELESPSVTTLWVYVQNPALDADRRDAADRSVTADG